MHLLDELRDFVHQWTESLWDPLAGGFRQNADVGANLLATTDVAWIRYATHDTDLYAGHREEWVRYLQQSQDAHTGKVSYGPGPGGQGHSDGHAFWHTVRALGILGGQLLHFPHHLRDAVSPDGLAAWFAAVDWDGPRSNHHEVLGLTPLLASLDDPQWAEVFYDAVVAQQNPQTGAWPRPRVNISRTYAYTVIHRAVGRMPPHAERTVDTILSLQQPNGFWQEHPAFHTMDAAYLLVRIPPVAAHRTDEAKGALDRLATALVEYDGANRDQIAQNPHRMLSIVHTFGLLQEAFPARFPSERSYRFDWDAPAAYRCEVIAREGTGQRSQSPR